MREKRRGFEPPREAQGHSANPSASLVLPQGPFGSRLRLLRAPWGERSAQSCSGRGPGSWRSRGRWRRAGGAGALGRAPRPSLPPSLFPLPQPGRPRGSASLAASAGRARDSVGEGVAECKVPDLLHPLRPEFASCGLMMKTGWKQASDNPPHSESWNPPFLCPPTPMGQRTPPAPPRGDRQGNEGKVEDRSGVGGSLAFCCFIGVGGGVRPTCHPLCPPEPYGGKAMRLPLTCSCISLPPSCFSSFSPRDVGLGPGGKPLQGV